VPHPQQGTLCLGSLGESASAAAGNGFSSDEEEEEGVQGQRPTPYIAAAAAATPPTATFSPGGGALDRLQARVAHMALGEQQPEGGCTWALQKATAPCSPGGVPAARALGPGRDPPATRPPDRPPPPARCAYPPAACKPATPVAQKAPAFGRHTSAAAGSTPYPGRTPANTPLTAAREPSQLLRTPLEKVLHMMAEPGAQGEGGGAQPGGPAGALSSHVLEEGSDAEPEREYDSSSDDEVTDPDLIELLQRSTGKVLVQRPARGPVGEVISMMLEPVAGGARVQ
jgi:hypothetical protein